MLIKLKEDAFVSGSKWKKGTVLECARPDAEKAINEGIAEATELKAESEKTKKEAKKTK